MTKAEIAQHMSEIDFAKGRKVVADAIAYVAKKNPVAAKPQAKKATAAKAEAVAQ